MRREKTGTYLSNSTSGEEVKAFLPFPLPPKPEIEWTPALRTAHEKAMVALGRLDGVTTILPAPHVFIYSYVRKEALLSSQIEGTQSTLTDLFAFEANRELADDFNDVVEVSNYVKAVDAAVEQIRSGVPLCNRLLRDTHRILLSEGRGKTQQPGKFRTSQNWIGGTRPGNARFVPPPHQEVEHCMAELERFINERDDSHSALTRAALSHLQFETIHPFLDGNGRLGRMLITLILIEHGLLKEPLLYLSLHLKQNRATYYELLDTVRATGDWESWLEFFFAGVEQTAASATSTAQALLKIFAEDRQKLTAQGRGTPTLLQIHSAFEKIPVFTAASLMKDTNLSAATVNKALERMEELGIVKESTGKKRNRLFVYEKYWKELDRGAEPIR
ncbi:MAG: Fic family protein [Deltaproteobacteria bacterium]|nr:Fic family protein [Deltaproteobacteria bacterium]